MKTIFLSCEDDSNLTVNCRSLGILQAGLPLQSQILDYCEDRITYNQANYISKRVKNKKGRYVKKSKK